MMHTAGCKPHLGQRFYDVRSCHGACLSYVLGTFPCPDVHILVLAGHKHVFCFAPGTKGAAKLTS
jgi:hypothetical protein